VHALLSLLLVSISVGLSNFAGAIGIGLSGINVRTRIRVGIAFGFFEALMPLIGLLIGQAAAGYISPRRTRYRPRTTSRQHWRVSRGYVLTLKRESIGKRTTPTCTGRWTGRPTWSLTTGATW